MAQDVRQYKSKEQDGQGNEIILRDQQLVEQTSHTTMASGEYFEIVDVDGRMAKIPKDNMIGVVREALGTLLNSLTDQTTVTKALTLNGDTLGASTAATLASVLGVGVLDHSRMDSPPVGVYIIKMNTSTDDVYEIVLSVKYVRCFQLRFESTASKAKLSVRFQTHKGTWTSYELITEVSI